MAKKNKRRQFIKNTLATAIGGALLGKTGFAISSNQKEKLNPILKTKALGFQWETQDPFLFCVHHEDFFPKGNDNMGPQASLEGRNIGSDFNVKDGWRMYHGQTVPGFPGHPHKGFETITVVRKGMVDHTDSMGASGRYGNGDVQWMTAGKGVQHAEMFPLLSKEEDNPMELFQIWLNLPKKNKTAEPHFKMLWKDTIPKIEHLDSQNKKTNIELIVGKIDKHLAPTPPPDSWAGDAGNEVAIWNIRMESEAEWELPKASEGIHRTVYFYSGDELSIGEGKLDNYHAADVIATESLILKAGKKDCHVLVLQGKPIGEPVVQHGPFVMNTRAEIQQAFAEYQETQFGGWPWPKFDFVHPRDKGRFALHANGKFEKRT